MDPIRKEQVQTVAGAAAPATFDDDAAATLVWANYNEARDYVENNAWLLEWQETDILYQSPTPDRFTRVQSGRPARVSRFLVAKFSRTLARAVKRAVFAEQIPFFLRPVGKETQAQVDAWTALISQLLKRMKFKYHGGLQINTQTLQGTGIGKLAVEQREVRKVGRKRKQPSPQAQMPSGNSVRVPTKETDEFEPVDEVKTETWPRFEYRRLGTTLFDPKWSTPDDPDESASYVIDVDYVNFYDLQRMRELSCYENIPDDETLKTYFFAKYEGSAPVGSQLEDTFTAQGSMVTHAEARNRQTDKDPLAQPVLMIEQRSIDGSTKTLLSFDDRKVIIRNDNDGIESLLHPTCTWWPIDNCGYGMGIGRINSSDQRINQGVLNESLKMIAYPFNAPILIPYGENAPTQNVIPTLGRFWQVRPGQNGNLDSGAKFMQMPEVPEAAWKMIEYSQRQGEDVSGANTLFQQGNQTGPGSSAVRTATGAAKVAGASDQSVADPVDSFADGVIVPTVEFLIRVVKEMMPLSEIREMLSAKHAAIIENQIAEDQFLDCEFEVTVLAGQKLAAKAGIQQLIPLFLQIVQQPQLLEYLHQRGETVDFGVMMDLMMQVSELQQQPDIIRPLTAQEMQTIQSMNPGAQRVAGALAVEKQRGQNKKEEIETKGDVDLGNKAAEIAMEKTADGIPLERATGLVERGVDEAALKNGLPNLNEVSG